MVMLDDQARVVLSERAFSENEPLSIATGIAIDSVLGLLEEAKDPEPPILKYDIFLVHIRTIYRNLIGSVPTELRNKLTPLALAEVMSTEMRVIETLISEATEGRCEIRFYHCNYSSIMNDFSRSLPKIPTTPGQKASTALEFSTYQALKEDIVSKPPIDYWNRKFPEIGGRGIVLTHYPVDLLNRYRFESLHLLESHTGAIKPPALWNTKLREGWGLEQLPFDRMTLQMFGDNIQFSPMNKKIRMTLFNIAVKKKWNHATTKDYVIHCVTEHRDPALEVLVKDLYRK